MCIITCLYVQVWSSNRKQTSSGLLFARSESIEAGVQSFFFNRLFSFVMKYKILIILKTNKTKNPELYKFVILFD